MPLASVGNVALYHEVRGGGPPVLFIGGTGGDLRHAPNVFDGPLPVRFQVASYDQRGLGRSSKPDEPATMADYGDDAAAVLDHLDWDAAAVIGVSFGGMVAQELTLRHPRRVRRLVLCCTSSGGAGGASFPLHELTTLPPGERFAAHLALADTRCDTAWQAAHPDEVAALAAVAEAREAIGTDDAGRRAGARRQLEARATHDTYDRLAEIEVPTLVCAGTRDGIAPLSNAEALAEAIPGAHLERFDGGHLFLLQDARAWSVIIDFLAEHSRTST